MNITYTNVYDKGGDHAYIRGNLDICEFGTSFIRVRATFSPVLCMSRTNLSLLVPLGIF